MPMVSLHPPVAGEADSLHDPQVYLLDFVPGELRMEVAKPFVVGFANCMATMSYLLRQGQFPRPSLVRQCSGIVPGLDKG